MHMYLFLFEEIIFLTSVNYVSPSSPCSSPHVPSYNDRYSCLLPRKNNDIQICSQWPMLLMVKKELTESFKIFNHMPIFYFAQVKFPSSVSDAFVDMLGGKWLKWGRSIEMSNQIQFKVKQTLHFSWESSSHIWP